MKKYTLAYALIPCVLMFSGCASIANKISTAVEKKAIEIAANNASPATADTIASGNANIMLAGEPQAQNIPLNSNDINKITLFKNDFQLIPDGITLEKGKPYSAESEKGAAHLFVLDNVRYGHLRLALTVDGKDLFKDQSLSDVVMAQGIVSKSIPTTGKARYAGDGIHIHGNDQIITRTNLEADFTEKTLKGSVQDKNGADLVGIDAKIKGTDFSQKTNIVLDGKFYGDDGAELAATYYGTAGNAATGAFGATKQSGNK